jgi:hypothetical protein
VTKHALKRSHARGKRQYALVSIRPLACGRSACGWTSGNSAWAKQLSSIGEAIAQADRWWLSCRPRRRTPTGSPKGLDLADVAARPAGGCAAALGALAVRHGTRGHRKPVVYRRATRRLVAAIRGDQPGMFLRAKEAPRPNGPSTPRWATFSGVAAGRGESPLVDEHA